MSWSWLSRLRKRDNVIVHTEGRQVVLPDVGDVTVNIQVNCLNTTCPRPQILAIKAFRRLSVGEVMELVTDNPASVESLASLALVLSARHLATLHEPDCWRIYLAKEEDESEVNQAI